MSGNFLRGTTAKLAVLAATVAMGAFALALTATPSSAATCNGYVGITFDDGPTGSTTTLLNILRNNGVRATMFNIGNNVNGNRSAAQAQVAAGMWVGNHSLTHSHMTSFTQAQMQSELSQTNQAIQSATGTTPRLFRPPFGETNATLQNVASSLGMRQIIWDVDSQDWNGASVSAIVAANGRLQNGQIILMHDGIQNTRDAIPGIMANLTSRNLCPGMISPSTGRAVAPDGTTPPTTPPPTTPGGGGSCTASTSPGTVFGDRYNTNVSVSGTNNWTVVVALPSPQRLQSSWNATVSVDGTGLVITARSNGSGNNWGFTTFFNGNTGGRPTVRSCTAG